MELNKSSSGGTAAGKGIHREQTLVEMKEEENLWEPTIEVNRLLGLEEPNTVSKNHIFNQIFTDV